MNDPATYSDDGLDLEADSGDGNATAWMLPEDPPEPARFADKPRKKGDTRTPLSTHTGTDPLGRAVGPAENHREIKKVIDPKTGRKVKPSGEGADRPDSPIAAELP